MKPSIKILFDGNISNKSEIESSLQGRILSIFDSNQFASIKTPTNELYVTVLVSCNSNDGQYPIKTNVEIDPVLSSDHLMYLLQISLSKLRYIDEVDKLSIFVSPYDYGKNKVEKDKQDSQVPVFVAIEPDRDFSNIILPKDVLNRLERAMAIIRYKKLIFDDLEFSRVDNTMKSIICFYGPAGTGKTITAKATAKSLGKKILISSYAQIESKYVGEGAKKLRAIFQAAEEQDAVLFLDEADSFLSQRIESTSSSSDKHYNRMSNELFQLLEDFSGVVIFATNLMTDIDNAFKSRIVDSIFFPLPDVNGRVKMLQSMVPNNILTKLFNEESLKSFAETLEGFSGRDFRKSLLLTYAHVAPKIANDSIQNFIWKFEDFKLGFDDVKETIENLSGIPADEVDNFTQKLKFKKKMFDVAKHALCADGNIDDREKTLLNELSQMLFGYEFNSDDITPTISLEKICEELSTEQKNQVIDTAIRVVTIDGEFSQNEREFITKLCNLLNFDEHRTNRLLNYSESMAKSYLLWIESQNNTIN